MGVTETLRILPTIFLSAACIQNVRLFGVYVVRWPFPAEIHTAPLKRFVPSSVIQEVRALRNAPAALAVFLAGVVPVLMTACISRALMCHDLWDRWALLPAPARKGGSCVTVLWVVVAVGDWSPRSSLPWWRRFRAGLGLTVLLGERDRRPVWWFSLGFEGPWALDLAYGSPRMVQFSQ